ncbi:MAG: polymerase primary sigma factor [Fibrobacteres bacterium]|nr:polymerase primary sigma factor [Fibrobacterota bacterium]
MESPDEPESAGEKPKKAPSRGVLPKNRDSLEMYLGDIKKAKTLSLEEEAALATRIQAGDMRAVNQLVQANLKFVVAVCRNYRFQGLSMGDLINEGNLGLLRAAQRFDGGMNFKFISYAVWWIRQGILTALAEQSRVLKLSAGKVGVIAKIGKANQRLEQKLGRSPSMAEVAEELGLSEVEINECLQLAAAPMSLNKPILGDGEGALEDVLEDKEADRPDKEVLQALSGKNLVDVLATLEEQEADVLKLYYGIGRESSETLEEIAARYGVTRERVRQIKAKALERLRHPTRMGRLNRSGD